MIAFLHYEFLCVALYGAASTPRNKDNEKATSNGFLVDIENSFDENWAIGFYNNRTEI